MQLVVEWASNPELNQPSKGTGKSVSLPFRQHLCLEHKPAGIVGTGNMSRKMDSVTLVKISEGRGNRDAISG
jgi:hypothetical protein